MTISDKDKLPSEIVATMPKEKWTQEEYVNRLGQMCFGGYILNQRGASIDYLYNQIGDHFDLIEELGLPDQEVYRLIEINDSADTFEEAQKKAVSYLRGKGH